MLILICKSLSLSSLRGRRLPLQTSRSYSNGGEVYLVNGLHLTYTQVQNVPAEQRTVAHWQVLIDWEMQRTRPYVIIDPFDPSGLLYLSTQEYLVQSRTLGSMNAPFIVVARPGSAKPTPVPSKTPPTQSGGKNWLEINYDPVTWRKMRDLRTFIARNVSWGKGETVKVNDGNIMGLVFVWSRELLHYLHVKKPGSAQDQFFGFGKHLQEILRRNGPDFLIKRLKILLFALYSYVGGNPLKSTEALGQRIRLTNGLPKVFSKDLRKSIQSGSFQRVRVWASLLNIYKYLEGTHGEPPLDTIGAPPFEGVITDFEEFCTAYNGFFRMLESEIGKVPKFEYKSSAGLAISSAGANTSASLSSIPYDAIAWSKTRNLPLEWFEMNGDKPMAGFLKKVMEESRYQWNLLELGAKSGRYTVPQKERELRMLKLDTLFPLKDDLPRQEKVINGTWTGFAADLPKDKLELYRSLLERWNVSKKIWLQDDDTFAVNLWLLARRGFWTDRVINAKPETGRLYAIPEPAGKVRVVAICDYFTQVALHPVHKYLFELLGRIPTDATFDQEGAVQSFAAKGYKDIYSYDLKSATDLIPWQLYEPLMKPLLGSEKTKLWLSLLRDRDFVIHLGKGKNKVEKRVRYTRGQPMGAYSSWAGLALVHHALVQYAARLAGYTNWFHDYLVLGDDIVIASTEVGQKYLSICEKYGITVGLAKSLESHKGLMNFASQTVIGNENISPISLREELSSNSWSRRIEYASRMDRRWGDKRGDGVASLRRILTYAQWQTLQSQLQGREWKHSLGFVLFFLQHPFVKGCDIGKVVSWLGLLSPELKTLPKALHLELDQALRAALWATLLRGVKSQRETCRRLLDSCKKLATEPSPIGGVSGFKTVWAYVGIKVAQDHFHANIFVKLEELWQWMIAVGPDVSGSPESLSKELPTLDLLVEKWIEFSRIPKVHVPPIGFVDLRLCLIDVLKGTQKVERGKVADPRKVVQKWTTVREGLAAPLGAILVAVAKVLGVSLPIYSLLHRSPPTSLRKALKLTLANTLDRWIRRDASPHLNRWILSQDLESSTCVPELPCTPKSKAPLAGDKAGE